MIKSAKDYPLSVIFNPEQNTRFIGYKNGLHLNDSLKDLSEWSVEHIKTRSQQLIKGLLEIFKLE